MIILYHNTKCGTSNKVLNYLKTNFTDLKVINYLEDKPTINKLTDFINIFGIDIKNLIREKDLIKYNLYIDNLTIEEKILTLHSNIQIMQRPIVELKNKVFIARPFENFVKDFENFNLNQK